MHRRLLCTSTALICLLAQAAFGRNIFITPNDPQSNQLATVNGEPFSYGTSVSTINGATAVFAAPNAQAAGTLKYYVVGASDSVGVLTGSFPNLTEARRIPVGMILNAGELSPDGRFLVVTGSAGVAVISTDNDSIVSAAGSLSAGTSPIDVAVSLDSRYAYVLSAASGRLTQIDLTSRTVVKGADVPSSANSVAVAPTGIVYVTASNQIFEFDPGTLAVRAVINVNGAPAALQFTPNGRFAIARNLVTFSGRGLLMIDLQARKSLDTPTSAALSSFVLVGDELGYALAPGGTLVEVRIGSDGTLSQVSPSVTGTLPNNISGLAVTGELPRSRSLIILTGSTASSLNTNTREIQGPINVGVQGNAIPTLPLSTNAVTGLLSFNNTLTAPAGSTTLPLSVYAYDANGFPATGASVNFSTTATGVTLSTTSATTNRLGLASTTVAIPAGRTGTIPVTATFANNRTVTYNVTIGDPGLPGGGGTGASGNKLTIVSGQGAAIKAGLSTGLDSDPLRVRYTDANGNVIPNATISWALVSQTAGGTVVVPGANVTCPTSDANTRCNVTDGDGIAVANVSTNLLISSAQPIGRYQVQATAPDGQSVLFNVVSVRNERNLGGLSVAATTPNNSPLQGRTGEILTNVLTYRFSSQQDPGVAVPLVGVKAVSDNTDPNLGPVASCRGGVVLSDDAGNVSCDLVVSGRPGQTVVHVNIGAGKVLYDYPLTVTFGLPAAVRVVSGDNQTVGAGQQATFTVQVTDSAGNPLQNVGVDWAPPQTATVVTAQYVTDASGRASITIQLPQVAGTYYVRATSNGIIANMSATVNAVTGNLTATGGDQQSAIVGQQFGQPLQVRVVDGSGNPLSGVSVSFAVISGSGTLSATSATTNAQGIASTNVTAGSTPGPIVVSASAGAFRVNFNLTSRLAGPQFTAADIVNGASFQPGISPGSIAFIRVSGIAPNLRGSVVPDNLVGPRPTTLADVQVLFNGIAAPIFSVSHTNGQESVAVQVPFEVPVGSANVTVNSPGGGSTTVSGVQIQALSPGVFTWVDPSAGNRTYAVAVRPDGSFVSQSNPARRGEVVRIYATGLGQTVPTTGTNRVGVPGETVAAPLVVGINNAGTRLVSSQLMEGTVGVYVIALEIPADTQAGSNQPVGLAVVGSDGTAQYANSVFIPIQ